MSPVSKRLSWRATARPAAVSGEGEVVSEVEIPKAPRVPSFDRDVLLSVYRVPDIREDGLSWRPTAMTVAVPKGDSNASL